MRYQGKISDWKDEHGFGFVTPNGGGQKAFVHIKSFTKRSTRPEDGHLVTYELAKDEKNRYYAKNIRLVGQPDSSIEHRKLSPAPTYFGVLFLALLLVLSIYKQIALNVFVFYMSISAITFFTYAIDKMAAKKSSHRTSEKTLHLLSVAGGWPGAIFAQKILRHKSKKESFQNTFWITVLFNTLAFALLQFSANKLQFWSEWFR